MLFFDYFHHFGHKNSNWLFAPKGPKLEVFLIFFENRVPDFPNFFMEAYALESKKMNFSHFWEI